MSEIIERKSYRTVLVAGASSIVALGLGLLIGALAINTGGGNEFAYQEYDGNAEDFLKNNIDNMSIRSWLEKLTADPHVGGTPEEENNLVGMIEDHMKASGLTVKTSEYKVLLSYPQIEEGMRNYIAVIDKDGDIIKDENENLVKSAEVEEILSPSQDNPKVLNPFIGYAKAGEISGDPVYVNFARKEDFEHLEQAKIETKGHICFARYGQIFRGNKARFAEIAECAGLVLFSDSADYSPEWTEPYPATWFLPETGAQRGTTYLDEGDPETPFYPSIPGAYRWTREKVEAGLADKHDLPGLPNIPIQPIGYGDALKFLKRMKGVEVPETWRGDIRDPENNNQTITYRYGPGLANDNEKVFMFIKNYEERRTTKDVIGYIEGVEEPDKYIILGNHRDAWVFGAIDPSSGTCVLLEVIKAFGELLKQGWKPRRSILFASWGSEEYGLIGSQEWVEEHHNKLVANSVIYLNTDIAVTGNYTFSPGGTPNTRDLVMQMTKKVDNPRKKIDSDEKGEPVNTLYDNMMFRRSTDGVVNYPSVGSGSDYAPFLQIIGTSVIDINFASDGYYPVYHSVYETFELVDELVDPGFFIHQSVGQFMALMLERLSTEKILSMSVLDYSHEVKRQIELLESSKGGEMKAAGMSFDVINGYANDLVAAAEKFETTLKAAQDSEDTSYIRQLNEKIFRFERSFIDPHGLPDRLQFKHVIFAPSSSDTYSSAALPAVYDAMYNINWSDDVAAENVKEQFATLSFFIYNAAENIKTDMVI